MSRKRVTAAASVVAQAKARASTASENVVTFLPTAVRPDGASAISQIHSRIDQTPDPVTGTPRLRVIIPGEKTPEIYELTSLMVQPQLSLFLAEGFRRWAGTVVRSSRLTGWRIINSQVSSFLATQGQELALASIDHVYWATFTTWLNGPRRCDGQPWAPSTRASVLSTMKNCITALLDHPEHGAIATALMDKSGFPNNCWPGQHKRRIPTAVLSPIERHAMILASLGEIAGIRERLNERHAILEAGRALLESARNEGCAPPYRTEFGVCAAHVLEAFPERLASLSDLDALDHALGRAARSAHGMSPIRKLLHVTFRDLVPFVLLIGVKTAFNPDSLLSLTWNQVKMSADKRIVTFLGVKSRASGLQISIVKDGAKVDHDFPGEPGVSFGLADVLDLLRRFTEHTRDILTDPDHANRLFIGAPAWGGTTVKAYTNSKGTIVDGAWKTTLAKFIKHHGLKPFTLVMIRSSEGEMEWRRTGDLLAVRDRLGHKSVSTTRTHYTSGGMRRESQERVAETQAIFHRWAQTEGRVDPRHQPARCRSAATPGFGCLDPFDSPRSGQRKGKFCTAYGECPDCPLAQAWPRDVQAAAYYLALQKAIHDARLGRISPAHWAKKWPSILIAHNRLLDEIPAEVRMEASRFHIKLKPVG